MANDASVDLIRSLSTAIEAPSLATEMGASPAGWAAFAVVVEFGDGYRSASGYAYSPDGDITPVAASWPSIEAAVNVYLGGYYQPGDLLPVKMLVQFDRTTGRYKVTLEDTDEERWKTRPKNFRQMREELRPNLD